MILLIMQFSSDIFYLLPHLFLITKQMEHPDSDWKRSSDLHESYQCRMYSIKLLMMGREDARNM